jgi:hypothetical protein
VLYCYERPSSRCYFPAMSDSVRLIRYRGSAGKPLPGNPGFSPGTHLCCSVLPPGLCPNRSVRLGDSRAYVRPQRAPCQESPALPG